MSHIGALLRSLKDYIENPYLFLKLDLALSPVWRPQDSQSRRVLCLNMFIIAIVYGTRIALHREMMYLLYCSHKSIESILNTCCTYGCSYTITPACTDMHGPCTDVHGHNKICTDTSDFARILHGRARMRLDLHGSARIIQNLHGLCTDRRKIARTCTYSHKRCSEHRTGGRSCAHDRNRCKYDNNTNSTIIDELYCRLRRNAMCSKISSQQPRTAWA